jgi:hypothetical protein
MGQDPHIQFPWAPLIIVLSPVAVGANQGLYALQEDGDMHTRRNTVRISSSVLRVRTNCMEIRWVN